MGRKLEDAEELMARKEGERERERLTTDPFGASSCSGLCHLLTHLREMKSSIKETDT